MKRHYFPNQSIDIDGYKLSITSTGKAYIVEKGNFKRIVDQKIHRGILLVELPNEKTYMVFPEGKGLGYREVKEEVSVQS